MEETNTETTPNCHCCDDSSRIASRRAKSDTMVVAACVYFLLTLERLLLNDDNVITTKTNNVVPAEHFQDTGTMTSVKHDEMAHVELIGGAMMIQIVAFVLVICWGTKIRSLRFSVVLGLGWISLNLILLMLGSAHGSIFPFGDGDLSLFVQGTVLVLEVQLMVMLLPMCRFVFIQGEEEMDNESSAESSASLKHSLLELEEV